MKRVGAAEEHSRQVDESPPQVLFNFPQFSGSGNADKNVSIASAETAFEAGVPFDLFAQAGSRAGCADL